MYIEFTDPKLSSDLDNPTLTVGVYPFQVAQEACIPVYATIRIDLNKNKGALPALTVGIRPFQIAQEACTPVYATIEIDLNKGAASSIPSAIPQEHHDDVLIAVSDLLRNQPHLFGLLAMAIHERCDYTPQEQDLIDLVSLANRYCPLGTDDHYNAEGYLNDINVICSSAWTAAFHFFTDMLHEAFEEEDAEIERQRIADICKRLDPDYVSEG